MVYLHVACIKNLAFYIDPPELYESKLGWTCKAFFLCTLRYFHNYGSFIGLRIYSFIFSLRLVYPTASWSKFLVICIHHVNNILHKTWNQRIDFYPILFFRNIFCEGKIVFSNRPKKIWGMSPCITTSF